ncbi:MAG: hypothetical protein OEY29_01765 [Gammaproteobacteria bacterium]|nr:hypothetical protein [Gammaproteobacteria bacterium]
MPIFRCEFKVTSDLVLDNKTEKLKLSDLDSNTSIFSNGPLDDNGHVPYLIITITGSADSIDKAEKKLRDSLAEQLDLLTFTTHSRFKIIEPIRLIEWDEGKQERNFKVFHTSDARYPPETDLDQKYLESCEIFDNAKPKAFIRTALKYFRYGILDIQPEDQFMRFWLALEIIAENSKEAERIPIACPECKQAMSCSACDITPTRVPMAKQAIENIIKIITGDEWKKISKRQFIARNGLMHGSSVSSIEKKCKMPISKVVNELAALVWHAIWNSIELNEEEESKLVLGHRDGEFVYRSIVASINGVFEHSGKEPHPTEENIPTVKITMESNPEM